MIVKLILCRSDALAEKYGEIEDKTLGPFEDVQLTYNTLRTNDCKVIIALDDDGYWREGPMDEPYSDIVIVDVSVSEEQCTKWTEEARQLGRTAGENAGSWAADGNTTQEHASRVLSMIEDGDPAADQYLPARPDLSGEWADAMTPQKLAEEILGDALSTVPDQSDIIDMLSDAWEEGVAETFQDTCQTELRKVIS